MNGVVSPLPYSRIYLQDMGRKKLPFLCKCDIKRKLYVGCRLTDIYHWDMNDYLLPPPPVIFKPIFGFSFQTGFEH
jgi:hypothetical protein